MCYDVCHLVSNGPITNGSNFVEAICKELLLIETLDCGPFIYTTYILLLLIRLIRRPSVDYLCIDTD